MSHIPAAHCFLSSSSNPPCTMGKRAWSCDLSLAGKHLSIHLIVLCIASSTLGPATKPNIVIRVIQLVYFCNTHIGIKHKQAALGYNAPHEN